MRPTATVGQYRTLLSRRTWGTSSVAYQAYISKSSGNWCFYNGVEHCSSASAALNTWSHLAYVRSSVSGLLTIYVNGISVYSAVADANSVADSMPLYIGAFFSSEGEYFQGSLDEFRITKGVARYTSNFSVPVAAHPDK